MNTSDFLDFSRFPSTHGGMTVYELIERLKTYNQELILPFGFSRAFSWRGSYQHIAFAPVKEMTVGQTLANVMSAVGTTHTGYKGGDYICTLDTECYLASDHGDYRGNEYDALTPSVLEWMVRCGEASK